MVFIEKLMVRKVNRKEFLMYVIFLLPAMLGLTNLIRNIQNFDSSFFNPFSSHKAKSGFGAGPYGGTENKLE